MKNQRKIRSLLQMYEKTQRKVPARVGNNKKEIDVPGRTNYIYARLRTGEVVEVYNSVAAVHLNQDIFLSSEEGLLKVHSFRSNTSRYGDTSDRRKVTPSHHSAHEWFAPEGGQDVVFSHLRQFMPFRPTPIGGMNLHVYRGIRWHNGWQLNSGASIDLSPYTPDTGSAHYALIYINTGSFPDFRIGSGSTTRVQDLALSDIPDAYPGTLPVAAVRLYGGQTGIAEGRRATDLIDLRFPFWHDHSFPDLDEFPDTYSGASGSMVQVNSEEDGLDFSYDAGRFFYQKDYVTSDETFSIPDDHQTIIYDNIRVSGTLNINGKLIIIPE